MSLVLDASVVLLWLVPQSNRAGVDYADAVLVSLRSRQAMAPSLLNLEVANAASRLEARKLVTEAEVQRFITLLGRLNIAIDSATAKQAPGDTLNLARRYRLSAYDAAYLELALRTGFPLASLDGALNKAASAAGVRVFG